MAAGYVTHDYTSSAGVTFTIKTWVPDTSAPDVGNVPVKISIDSTGTEVWTAANSTALLGYVDGIEGKLDALHTDLATTLAGYVDGLEGILGTTAGAAVITDANGTIQQYLRGLIKQWIAGTLVLGAGSNAIGKLAANAGVYIGDVGHGKTIKTVSGSLTADTDVVAAVTSKRIKVIAYSLISTGVSANPAVFKSNGTGGTELWRVILQAPAASSVFGANLSIPAPSFLFATVAGEKLTLDVGNTDTIHYSIAYFDDDAS